MTDETGAHDSLLQPHALHVRVLDDGAVQVSGASPAEIVGLLQAVAGVVVLEDGADATPDPSVARLLDREADIVELVASGLSNQAIAQHLFLSVNTVKSYIRSAYRKMGVESRSQAVLWAVEHRMVRPGHRDADIDTDTDTGVDNPGA